MNPAPPPTLVVQPQGIPATLAGEPHWLGLRADWIPQRQKYNKPPIDAAGRVCDKRDCFRHMSLADALRTMRRHNLAGVGHVLLKEEGIVGIDGDKCRDPQTGVIADWAREIIDSCRSYTEASISGTGIRIFVAGTLPDDVDSGKRAGPIELYHHHAFLGVTGHHLQGTPTTVEANQPAIDALYARVVGRSKAGNSPAAQVWATPCTLPPTDLRQRAAQGRIRWETLQLLDSPGRPGDSELDMKLCCALVGAGLAGNEVLALILGSVRGQSAADRKGARYLEGYWRRTVENAARHVGPVVETGTFRLRDCTGTSPLRRTRAAGTGARP